MTDTAPDANGQGGAGVTEVTNPAGSTAAALAAQPPATPANPPATPAANGTAPSWLEGADDLTKGYVQNKGWDTPLKAIDSYRNLEKLLGADRAGNTVVIPKHDAPPEEMAKFYERIGRPSAPDGYKLEVPEGAPKEFAAKAAEWFFNHGVPKAAAEGVATEWNKFMTEQKTAMDAQKVQAFQADDVALKQAWGGAFVQELAKAQAAVRALGVTDAQLDSFQASMGHKATMEFFAKLGAKMGEPDFTTGGGQKGFGEAMTPEQAKAKIAELTQDRDFVKRYVNKDSAAVAQMKELHAFAYPEAQA